MTQTQDPSTPSYCSSQPASKVMRCFPPSSQTIDHLKENVARCCYGDAKFAWAGLIAQNNLNLKSWVFWFISNYCENLDGCWMSENQEWYRLLWCRWQLFATQHTTPRFRVDFQLGNTYEIEVVTCSNAYNACLSHHKLLKQVCSHC